MRDILIYWDEGTAGSWKTVVEDYLDERYGRGGQYGFGSPEVYITNGGIMVIETSDGFADWQSLANDLAQEFRGVASVDVD